VKRARVGNARLFNQSLDLMWQETLSNQLSGNELQKLQDRVIRLIPSTRKAPHDAYDAQVECAVLALGYCIRTKLTGDTFDLTAAASQAFESISHILKKSIRGKRQVDPRHPQWHEQVSAQALIRSEHLRQKNDLLDIQQADTTTAPDVIARIRKRAEIDSVSLLPAEVIAAPGPRDTARDD